MRDLHSGEKLMNQNIVDTTGAVPLMAKTIRAIFSRVAMLSHPTVPSVVFAAATSAIRSSTANWRRVLSSFLLNLAASAARLELLS